MMRVYRSQLRFYLKGQRGWIVIVATVILLFFTFFMMGVKPPKVVFFPEGDPNNIYVYIKMPAGTHIDATDAMTRKVENIVFDVLGHDNADVESVISNIAVNAGEDIFERTAQDKLAKISISFEEYKDRTGPSTTIYLDQLRESLEDIPGVEISVAKELMGPPTGKPINIEISGEEFSQLIPIVEEMKYFIDSLNIPGIEHLKKDLEVNSPELTLNINRKKANKYGMNTAFIGMGLRTALYGKEISKIREGDEEYDIRLRLQESYRSNLEHLLNLNIMVPGGDNGFSQIPISSVVDAAYTSAYGGIIRKDFKRVITLSSNVLTGYNANEIVLELQDKLKDFPMEEGYTFEFTGEQEDQAENASFLSVAFLAAILVILVILVMQFNSIIKPVIIILQIVFSMIGVLLGITLFNIDFSIIMTGMGIIAVGGIVVKNAIILIDYTDILIAKGMEKSEAIIEAGATRLTPVILTAASTILGLLPLAIGMNIDFLTLFTEWNPNIYFGGDNAAFWQPLAWTIIFGLAFATFLTLVLVPSMYKIFIRVKKKG
jgi:multidrug efflux pump subunit AcrB